MRDWIWHAMQGRNKHEARQAYIASSMENLATERLYLKQENITGNWLQLCIWIPIYRFELYFESLDFY